MAAQGHTDGYLFDVYRRYVGEPDGRLDVYVGFGLFLAGVCFALVGLVLFLYSSTFTGRVRYDVAEPAFALGMLAPPVTMLGITVLLPIERKVLATSIVGAAITVVAVGGFLVAYPEDWNFYGENYTVPVVATYAVGLAGISASTGAALIAHYLELARTVEGVDLDDDEEAEHYTDEEIRGDIDAAMADVELSWGGVEKDDNSKLQFTDHEFEGETLQLGTKTVRSSGVDEQVAGLKGLKGGDTKTTTSSSTVDDQTAKLRELREQRRKEELEANAGGGALAPLTRVKTRLFGGGGLVATLRERIKRN